MEMLAMRWNRISSKFVGHFFVKNDSNSFLKIKFTRKIFKTSSIIFYLASWAELRTVLRPLFSILNERKTLDLIGIAELMPSY